MSKHGDVSYSVGATGGLEGYSISLSGCTPCTTPAKLPTLSAAGYYSVGTAASLTANVFANGISSPWTGPGTRSTHKLFVVPAGGTLANDGIEVASVTQEVTGTAAIQFDFTPTSAWLFGETQTKFIELWVRSYDDCTGDYTEDYSTSQAYVSSLLVGVHGYWSLNETSGTRADAISSQDLTTDQNTVDYETGKNGNAAKYIRANSETLIRPTNGYTGPTGDFSISAWVKVDTTISQSAPYIIAWNNGSAAGAQSFLIRWDSTVSKFRAYVGDGSASVNTYSNAISAGEAWNHVIMTWSDTSGTINLYVNGDAGLESSALAGSRIVAAGELYVGAQSATGYFTGSIDELTIWERVLSSAERSALYNSGTGKFYPFTS